MKRVLDTAIGEIGITEVPANSNRTKYGHWFGMNGLAWCGIFVSWCYAHSGVQLPNIGYSYGYAGCQTAVEYFRKHNKIVKDPRPGDIVFFDWNKDGRYDHTGIFEEFIPGYAYFTCIEGNTALGNDSNGGKVMRRTRSVSTALFVRP